MMTTVAAAKDDLKDGLKEMPLPPAPFLSSVMQIEPQWIDYNGHLNMQAAWAMYEGLGFVRFPDIDFSVENIDVFGFWLDIGGTQKAA